MNRIFSFDLEGKVYVVTGGYGYLGEAITNSLIFHNATVYVLARNEEKFNERLLKKGQKASPKFMMADIESSMSINKAFEKIYSEEGKIDGLINNAFYLKGQSPENMLDEDWNFGVDGTLSSVFRCIRAIIPIFKERNRGNIVNVSSMYGLVAPDFRIYDENPTFLNPPHYGASKAGVIQLTRYYAAYLGKWGINVNCVTPGPFPSESVQMNVKFIEELKQRTLLNRIGKPEDLAGAFVFFASDAANFITGQNLIVDGGWTAK